MPNLLNNGSKDFLVASLAGIRKAGNEKIGVDSLSQPRFFISSLTYADREP